MAFLKRPTAIEAAEAELAKLHKQRERLIAQEKKQRETLDAAISARKRSVRGEMVVDNAAIERARNEDAVLAAVRDALDDLASDVDATTAKLAQARDEAARKAEAAAREADRAAAQAALAEFLLAAEKVTGAFSRMGNLSTACADVAAFAKHVRIELTVAGAAALDDLGSYIARVLDGRQRPLPYQEPAIPTPRPAQVPTLDIYALENLKWADAVGETKTLGKYVIGRLPVAAAESALELGLAELHDSARARALIEAFGNAWHPVDPEACHDLDHGGARVQQRARKSITYKGARRGSVTYSGAPWFVPKPAEVITGTIAIARAESDQNDGGGK